MSALFLVFGVAFLLALVVLAFALAREWARARGPRVIVCPETNTPEFVEVDARRAAWTSIAQEAQFTLASCSRWPERQACGQECLAQIESAPDGCLVRQRLASWYEGSSCAMCGKTIGEIQWFSHKPGFVGPGRRIVGWNEVPVEELVEVLGTYDPICWDCQAIETFRARFPDLVIDDPRPAPLRSTRRKTGSAA